MIRFSGKVKDLQDYLKEYHKLPLEAQTSWHYAQQALLVNKHKRESRAQ